MLHVHHPTFSSYVCCSVPSGLASKSAQLFTTPSAVFIFLPVLFLGSSRGVRCIQEIVFACFAQCSAHVVQTSHDSAIEVRSGAFYRNLVAFSTWNVENSKAYSPANVGPARTPSSKRESLPNARSSPHNRQEWDAGSCVPINRQFLARYFKKTRRWGIAPHSKRPIGASFGILGLEHYSNTYNQLLGVMSLCITWYVIY